MTGDTPHGGPRPVDLYLDAPEHAIVTVDGPLDETAGIDLRCEIALALGLEVHEFDADLTAVDVLDLDGLDALVEVARYVRAAGAVLTVVDAPPLLKHLLYVAGVGSGV